MGWLRAVDWREAPLVLRSCCAIAGSLVFWSSMWTLLDDSLSPMLWEEGPARDWSYVAVGLVGCVVTRTFFFQTNVPGAFIPPPPPTATGRRALHLLRMYVSEVALILAWVGLYAELENVVYMNEDSNPNLKYIISVVYMIVGQALGLMTNTLVPPVNEPPASAVYTLDDLARRQVGLAGGCVLFCCKVGLVFNSLMGLFGDVLTWVGIDVFLVNYESDDQYVAPKIIYIVVGLSIQYVAKTMPVAVSMDDIDFYHPGRCADGCKGCADDGPASLSISAISADEEEAIASIHWAGASDMFENDRSTNCMSGGVTNFRELGNFSRTRTVELEVLRSKQDPALRGAGSAAGGESCSRFCLAARCVAGSLGFFTTWVGVESLLFFHGFEPIPREPRWWASLLTAFAGVPFLLMARASFLSAVTWLPRCCPFPPAKQASVGESQPLL